MKNAVRMSLMVMALAMFGGEASWAAEPREIGKYGDWVAYAMIENGQKVCYMASQPQKAEGQYKRRGDVFALVTHRPAEGSKNVFSYITGYSYKTGSDASMKIDGQDFTLFTQDDTAWAPDGASDNAIIQSLRKGSSMIVKGVSSRGTPTTDTFGLKGSGAAYDAITRECGL